MVPDPRDEPCRSDITTALGAHIEEPLPRRCRTAPRTRRSPALPRPSGGEGASGCQERKHRRLAERTHKRRAKALHGFFSWPLPTPPPCPFRASCGPWRGSQGASPQRGGESLSQKCICLPYCTALQWTAYAMGHLGLQPNKGNTALPTARGHPACEPQLEANPGAENRALNILKPGQVMILVQDLSVEDLCQVQLHRTDEPDAGQSG